MLTLAAVAWRQTSYWRDAETLWTHAVSCTGPNLLAHYGVALCYTKQDRTEEAIREVRAALAADSIDPLLIAQCHELLGNELTKQGKADEALRISKKRCASFQEASGSIPRSALAFASAGQHDQAIAQWRETVRLAPAYWSARVGLAQALLAGGEAGEAIDECRQVLEQEPAAIEAIAILGAALAAEGQVEEGLPYLNRAVELDPGNVTGHFHLGLALQDRGRPQIAIAHLNAAIRLRPDDTQMLWPVAWLLATSPNASVRDGARAIDLATRAIQLSGGKEPRAFDALAAGLAETADFTAAVATAEQASTIALTHGDAALADAIRQRAELYRQGLPYRQSAHRTAAQAPLAD